MARASWVVPVVLSACFGGGSAGLGFGEGESCTRTVDCADALRCIDQTCAFDPTALGDTCAGDDCMPCPGDAVGPSMVVETAAQPPSLVDVLDGLLVDLHMDGSADQQDFLDADGDGLPDDYDEDGFPDNRFYFDDVSAWVPDADSFDDFEDGMRNIPRGVTPISTYCAPDGIETGPLQLGHADYRPSSYCVWVIVLDGEPCLPVR